MGSLESRVEQLEQQATPSRGFRHYASNDVLEARGLFVDCNDDALMTRVQHGLAVCTGLDVDELDDDARERLVDQQRIDADEREGWQVIVVTYTDRAQ
jgi:hypothetical protein